MSDAVYALFLWLDASEARFLVTAWVCFGALLLVSLWPYQPGATHHRWNPPWLYAGLLLLTLLAFLWPLLGVASEFNPDESQLLAGAITAWQRHVIWSIDMGYCGPWSFLPLTLPGFLGWPIDYVSGRCMALLMMWGSVVLVWLSLRHILTDTRARLLVLPMVCFLAFTQSTDFAYFSGEQSPQFYFAAALWLLTTAFNEQGSVARPWRLPAGGLFLGLLPFSKLQAAPLGVLLGGVCLAAILLQRGRPLTCRVRDAAALVGGVLLALGFTLGCIAASGSLFHFYESYLVAGLQYAGIRGYPTSEFSYWIWQLATASGFGPFLWSTWLLLLLALPLLGRIKTTLRRPLLLGGALLLGGYFTVWAPGRASSHYLMFLLLPTTFLVALLYGGLLARLDRAPWKRGAWLIIFIGLGVAPQIYAFYSAPPSRFMQQLSQSRIRGPGPVVKLLASRQRPGDTLSVWGWECSYHVQTQLPQGTREAHTERQMVYGPLQEYFRQRYLEDLQRSPPTFFLDAVGQSNFRFNNREVFGHDRWPALQSFINGHYAQIGDVETTRIYVRLDRLAETPPPPRD